MLTYFFPILPLDVFRGDQNRTLGRNGLNRRTAVSHHSNAPSHTIVTG